VQEQFVKPNKQIKFKQTTTTTTKKSCLCQQLETQQAAVRLMRPENPFNTQQ
jgi:hypothetical protein